jgi:hypothetical protein
MTGSASTSFSRVNACAQNCQMKNNDKLLGERSVFWQLPEGITLGLVWLKFERIKEA